MFRNVLKLCRIDFNRYKSVAIIIILASKTLFCNAQIWFGIGNYSSIAWKNSSKYTRSQKSTPHILLMSPILNLNAKLSRNIELNTGFGWVKKGYKLTNRGNPRVLYTKHNNQFLQFQIQPCYSPNGKSKIKHYIGLGTYIGYLLKSTIEGYTADPYSIQPSGTGMNYPTINLSVNHFKLKKKLKHELDNRFDFGFLLSYKISFPIDKRHKFQIATSYQHGITDLIRANQSSNTILLRNAGMQFNLLKLLK